MSFTWLDSYENEKMQFSEFETIVRTNVDEDEVDIVSSANLMAVTNEGLREMAFQAEVMRDYCTIAADGSEKYTLPSDLIKVKSVLWETNGNIEYLVNATEADNRSAIGKYSIVGNQLYVYGSISTGNIKVHASKMPTKITSASSYIDIPYEYIYTLGLYVEWRYWRRKRALRESTEAFNFYFQSMRDLMVKNEQKNERGVKLFGKVSQTKR